MEEPKPNLMAYALGEATPLERNVTESLLSHSAEACEEFERIQATIAALKSLPQEEMPRRIAFVSDPVFQPSWWQRFWASTPQLGFASAALLAAAITTHGFVSKSSMPPPQPIAQQATAPALTQADVDQAVDQAIAKAVSIVEKRQQAATEERIRIALSEAEKRHATDRQLLAVRFEENLNYMRKQMNQMYVANARLAVE
jgi:anti-sigma factor RsiW